MDALLEVVFNLSALLKTDLKAVRLILIDSVSSVFRELMHDFAEMVRLQHHMMMELENLVDNCKILVSDH